MEISAENLPTSKLQLALGKYIRAQNQPPIVPVEESQITVDYGRLLEDERHCDVKLILTIGGEQQEIFTAHKAILSNRSSVFSAMFDDSSKFVEASTGEVIVEDIERDVFEDLLRFIYTDEAPDSGGTSLLGVPAQDFFGCT